MWTYEIYENEKENEVTWLYYERWMKMSKSEKENEWSISRLKKWESYWGILFLFICFFL